MDSPPTPLYRGDTQRKEPKMPRSRIAAASLAATLTAIVSGCAHRGLRGGEGRAGDMEAHPQTCRFMMSV